jgi:hypothetical protein
MQAVVKLGLTSGCQDDRGNMDKTTRWFVWVPCDVVARKCSCVGQQLFYRVFGYLHHQKTLNFTMYMKQMVLFTLVMQHWGLTSLSCHHLHNWRQMQDLVKLGLTRGCQNDRGTMDESTRWFVWVPCDVVARQCSCVGQLLFSRVYGYLLHKKTLISLCTWNKLF